MDQYSERLYLLYTLCLAEDGQLTAVEDAPQSDMLEAATYLACRITLQAIQHLQRTPQEEMNDIEALSVYQAFAMLLYVYLMLPLQQEGVAPDIAGGAVTIARSLFAELPEEALLECIASGDRKFQLIGNARHEHWMNYRQDMDKSVIAYLIAGTDDSAPFDKDELIPVFAAMLNQLCEAMES